MSGRRARRSPPPFLLDTHVWFWYLTESERLARSLREAIDGARGELWLSPVSLWELGMLHERGRVRLKGGLRAWTDEAFQRFPLQEASLNREVAVASTEVAFSHRDPADRFLAATALVYGLSLVTADERLIRATWLPTRSG